MGGIGKSQLAANFFKQHGRAFSAAFWLRATTDRDLRRSLVQCAKRIPVGQISETSRKGLAESAQQEQIIVDEVLDRLGQEGNSNWFLVLDEVDSEPVVDGDQRSEFYNVLDRLQANHGAALITTRLPKLAHLGGAEGGDASLHPLKTELSRKIFEKWYGSSRLESLGDDAAELLEEPVGDAFLGGLPLALAQAAIYIKNMKISVSEYKRRYQEMWPHVMAVEEGQAPILDYSKSVGTTWFLSLRQVEETNPYAVFLVRAWAFVDNKGFWYGLLSDLAEDKEIYALDLDGMSKDQWRAKYGDIEAAGWLRALSQDEGAFLNCMTKLQDFALVEPMQGSVAGSDVVEGDNIANAPYRWLMHPVMHSWAMQMQTKDEQNASLRDALRMFRTRHPPTNSNYYWSWERKQLWLPHANKCQSWATTRSFRERNLHSVDAVEGMACIEALHEKSGYSEQSIKIHEFLQDKIRCSTDDDEGLATHISAQGVLVPWPLKWHLLRSHGLTLFTFERFTEAETKLQTALVLAQKAGKPSLPYARRTLLSLADIYLHRKEEDKFTEALTQVSQLLASTPTNEWNSKDRYHGFVVASQLGELRLGQKRYDEAEVELLKAFSQSQGMRGQLPFAEVSYSLGMLKNRTNRPAAAEELLRQALEISTKHYPNSHTRVIVMHAELAWSCALQGKHAAAQEAMTLAISSVDGNNLTTALSKIRFYTLRMRDDGKLSFMESMVKTAWEAAFAVLQAHRPGELRKNDRDRLVGTYECLRMIYEDQERSEDLESLQAQWLSVSEGIRGE